MTLSSEFCFFARSIERSIDSRERFVLRYSSGRSYSPAFLSSVLFRDQRQRRVWVIRLKGLDHSGLRLQDWKHHPWLKQDRLQELSVAEEFHLPIGRSDTEPIRQL